MGVWGAGLYQSDIALDLRAAYRDGGKLGFSGERLAALAIDMAAPGEAERDLADLVLADLLWRDGRLSPERREAALAMAARPEGVLEFDEAALQRGHLRTLAAVGAKLAAPQRLAGPAREPYVEQSDFAAGEALAYPDGAGGWLLMRVVTLYTRFGGRSPVVELLDWAGTALPDAATIARLPYRRQRDAVIVGAARPEETVAGLIALGRLPAGARWEDYEAQMAAPHIPVIRIAEKDAGFRKVVRLGVEVPATRPFTSDWFIATNAWTRWKDLPGWVGNYFGDWDAPRT